MAGLGLKGQSGVAPNTFGYYLVISPSPPLSWIGSPDASRIGQATGYGANLARLAVIRAMRFFQKFANCARESDREYGPPVFGQDLAMRAFAPAFVIETPRCRWVVCE